MKVHDRKLVAIAAVAVALLAFEGAAILGVTASARSFLKSDTGIEAVSDGAFVVGKTAVVLAGVAAKVLGVVFSSDAERGPAMRSMSGELTRVSAEDADCTVLRAQTKACKALKAAKAPKALSGV